MTPPGLSDLSGRIAVALGSRVPARFSETSEGETPPDGHRLREGHLNAPAPSVRSAGV